MALSTCPRSSSVDPGLTWSRRLIASRFLRLSWFDWSSVEEFASKRNRMSLLSSGSASSDAPPPERIGAIATSVP